MSYSYYIEVIKATKHDDLVDNIQLFLDKNERYYSNKHQFDRKVTSCSIVYENGEYIATIIYEDIWR